MPVFSLKLLGGAMLEGAGGPIRGRAVHRRRIALLAVLAAARGRAVRRDKVIGLIWPEHPTDSARHLLSESLYVLRKELGDDAFVVVGDEVALNSAVVSSDLCEFGEALANGDHGRATELYHGPLLDGFYISDAAEFERWVDGERDRVARAYADAVETLAEAAEESGDYLTAAELWRRRTLHDPFSSRVVLRLMGALESGGEHLGAIRAAADHTTLLRDELGAAPDPLVPAYAERLRTAPPAGRMPVPSRSCDPVATTDHTCVSEVHMPDSPADPQRERRVVALEPATLPSAAVRQWAGRLRHSAAALAIIAAAGTVALSFWMAESREAKAEGPDPRHIAVLYLDDHSPDRTLGFLSAMLTEGVTDQLAQTSSLRVTSRNAVKPFRDARVPLDSIVRELGVGSLVEGSVERSGRRIRATVRLVDAWTGRVQSHTVEQPMADSIALAESMARDLAVFVRQRLGPQVRQRQRSEGTGSTRARALLLDAERLRDEAQRTAHASALDNRFAILRLRRADSLLAEASRVDPEWIEPWLLRGWISLALRDRVVAAEQPARFLAALRYANAALRLRKESPDALELAGTARWRIVQLGPIPAGIRLDTLEARAQRDLEVAVINDNSLARAWSTLSQILRVKGRYADADAAARRAWEEDEYLEDAPVIVDRLYRSSLNLARFDSAAAWCARGQERFPDDYRFVECRLNLLGYDGPERPDTALAWRLYRELEQMDPSDAARRESRGYTPLFRRMAVARVMVRAGDPRGANELVRGVRRDVGNDRDMLVSQAYDEAYIRLLLGERDASIDLLERYVDGEPTRLAYLAHDLKFQPLHGNPRFQRLLKTGIR